MPWRTGGSAQSNAESEILQRAQARVRGAERLLGLLFAVMTLVGTWI